MTMRYHTRLRLGEVVQIKLQQNTHHKDCHIKNMVLGKVMDNGVAPEIVKGTIWVFAHLSKNVSLIDQ